ncbi:MAG: VOC family protein [Fluviicola sp.]|nr:VOC family protein [Fluviicola sp.]
MAQPIYPCFWFNNQAKEAAVFHCSLFEGATITAENPLVVMMELNGQKYMHLNGGPMFNITPAISMFVTCETDQEIESLWEKLSHEGEALMPLGTYPWSEKYAWVKDKFGLTWQLMLGQVPPHGQKIHPVFLFSSEQYGKARAALNHYAAIFPNSILHEQQLYTAGEGQPEGNLKFGHFNLNGAFFAAMDGPGDNTFSEGFSLVVNCDTQDEIDHYWNALSEGGYESQCGWLKDQFGVSWQIVPTVFGQLMSDPEKSERVVQAFMKMKKMDIATLENA